MKYVHGYEIYKMGHGNIEHKCAKQPHRSPDDQ